MSELNINTLGLIRQIWNEKEWKFPSRGANDVAFNNLCEMFTKLDKDEQELVINLMRCYSFYSHTDYQDLLVEAFLKIEDNQIDDVDKIVIAPLVKAKDVQNCRSKSGYSLLYAADLVAINENKKLAKLERKVIVNPYISRDKLSGEKLLVILIDDFVGSGDTAVEVVNLVKNNFSAKDKIIVTCLVTIQKGIDRLNSASIPFFFAKSALKGIQDNHFIENKNLAYQLIDKIWKDHLAISEQFKRGYKDSEALLTLMRTPNNTLPMYWCKKARDGSDWPSPFTR